MSKFFYSILFISVLTVTSFSGAMEEKNSNQNNELNEEKLMRLDKKALCRLFMTVYNQKAELSAAIDKVNEKNDNFADNENNDDIDIKKVNQSEKLQNYKWGKSDTFFFGGIFLACIYFIYNYFTYKEDKDEGSSE